MKFPTEDLCELVSGGSVEGYELIEDNIDDTTRWSILHSIVFKFEDKFYTTCYSEGATEMQDESPFEHEGDEVECFEVKPVEVVVTQYQRV